MFKIDIFEKFYFCIVRDPDVGSRPRGISISTHIDRSQGNVNFQNDRYFRIYGKFGFEPNQSIWSIFPWKWHGKVGIMLLTSFEVSLMHMYDMDFRDTWFSRSPLQNWPYLKIRYFTFLRKNLICGLIFEISGIPQKLETFSYIPSKYEVNRTETHNSQTISKISFLLSHHGKLRIHFVL